MERCHPRRPSVRTNMTEATRSKPGQPRVRRAVLCAISFCLVVVLACAPESTTNVVGSGVPRSESEVEDGGSVKNEDRDRCAEYFEAFANIGSASEEKRLFTEFGDWLTKRGYLIEVEAKNGKHVLSCPYFPPVTPWTEHSCFDVQHLKLLPQ